jgi:RHS repeat-associated protein
VVDPDGALGSASLQTDDYLWDGGELVGVTGYNSLVFASGPAPDMVLFESASTLHALLGDHQNTVRDVVNTSGTVENHLVYNSYGDLKSQTGGGAYSPFHRFTGKPFDVAVGLQYNINRWYDAAIGRWISEDPIGFGGGHPNLNVYVANSPANGTDTLGLAVWGDDGLRRTYIARGVLRHNPNDVWIIIEDHQRRNNSPEDDYGWDVRTNEYGEEVADIYVIDQPSKIGRILSGFGMPGVSVIGGLGAGAGAVKAPRGGLGGAGGLKAPRGGSGQWKPTATEGHHGIPTAIQKNLPPSVRKHPDVRGRRGNPNVRQIPYDDHRSVHNGPNGGPWNQKFIEEIGARGGFDEVTPQLSCLANFRQSSCLIWTG